MKAKLIARSLIAANVVVFVGIVGVDQLAAGGGGGFCDPETSPGCLCYAGDPFQPGGCYEDEFGEVDCFNNGHCSED